MSLESSGGDYYLLRQLQSEPSCLELAPEQKDLERLIGQSVIEFISRLPTFSWFIDSYGVKVEGIGISTIATVDYKTERKDALERYNVIQTTPGVPINKERLTSLLLPPSPEWTTAIISQVSLDRFEKGMKEVWAHIPFIDIDSDLPLDELIPIVKEQIKKTEISEGVILASSGSETGHFHVIGTRRLLTSDQLRVFFAASMFMEDNQREMLICPRFLRIALFPKMHAVSHGSPVPKQSRVPGSIYDFSEMFAVLRVSTSKRKPYLPKVIDVL
jgi:hypothetical protein